MKKVYTKPAIVFDSFELAQSIAAGCAIQQSFAEYVCAVKIPGWGDETVYNDGTCYWTSDDMKSSICYHAPLDTNNVYTS